MSGHRPRPVLSALLAVAALAALVGLPGAPASAESAPANDNRANAQVLPTTLSGSQNGTTVGATKEDGEGNVWVGADFCAADDQSVWYSWTAPETADVYFTIALTGEADDSTMRVFSVAGNGDLTFVAENDDEVPGRVFSSQVPLAATAGTTYLIRVAAACSATWPFTLKWERDEVKPAISSGSVQVQRWDVRLAWGVIEDFPGWTATCQLDSGDAVACSSPWTVQSPRGAHTITLRITDRSGNTSAQLFPFSVKPGRIRA